VLVVAELVGSELVNAEVKLNRPTCPVPGLFSFHRSRRKSAPYFSECLPFSCVMVANQE
jgi:hypothetical protein